MSVIGLSMFAREFWGDRNQGFEALTQNVKSGVKNANEFCELIREVNAIEDNYAKSLFKLSKLASTYSTAGSFKSCWSMASAFIEHILSTRAEFETEWSNLLKDLQKYVDELQKRQRLLKDSEASTQEVVHSFQVATTHLHKAKDLYHTRYNEYKRVRLNETHSTRDIEKTETKLKKAQDEYKYSVEKYNNLRLQFVDKMRVSCANFEKLEYAHLTRMCDFLARCGDNMTRAQATYARIASEFNQRRASELTPDLLLVRLVKERGTGTKEPPQAEFEDVEVAAAFQGIEEASRVEGIVDVESLKDVTRSGGASSSGTTGQSSTPNQSHLASAELGSLRAASALPAVGSTGTEYSSVANLQGTSVPFTDPTWQSSLNEICVSSTTHSMGLTRRTGNLFQRRNQQNSTGPDADAASVLSGGSAGLTTATAIPTTAAIAGASNGSFAQRLANVRNLARLPRKASTSPSYPPGLKGPHGLVQQLQNSVEIDEEGYNIRPENVWSDEDDNGEKGKFYSSSDDEDSVVTSPGEKTFRGIKVHVRPLGDLAPAVVAAASINADIKALPHPPTTILLSPTHTAPLHAPPSSSSITSSSANGKILPIRDLRRPQTSVGKPLPASPLLVGGAGGRSNSVTTGPIVPMLPPPPGQETLSSRRLRTQASLSTKGTPTPFATSSPPLKKTSSTGDKVEETVVEPFNPFGLPIPEFHSNDKNGVAESAGPASVEAQTHRAGSTIGGQNDWKAFFPSATSTKTSTIPAEEPYDRLIDLRDDDDERDKTLEHATGDQPAEQMQQAVHAPLAVLEDEDADAPVSESCHRQHNPPPPLPPAPPPPLPPAPATRILPHIPTETTQKPQPAYILPIAIAMTETWRAQFPNGGGSSFTTMERPEQSLFGQVTLAVAREDLRHLSELRKQSLAPSASAALTPMVLVFSHAGRMKSMQASFSGVAVIYENISDGKAEQYRVTIPGDLLYHYLVATLSATPQGEAEEYTRLSLLDYGIDLTGLSPPISMCTYWRCEKTTTDFRLDYYLQWPKWASTHSFISNGDAGFSETSCQDLRVNLMVDGGVSRMQSRPLGTWNTELGRASWSIPVSGTDRSTSPKTAHPQQKPGVDVSGNIRAKFFLNGGPGTPQPVALQFCRDGGPLPSGAVLSLGECGYRLTMCKYRLLGDRYFCDPPVVNSGGSSAVERPPALPPTSSSSSLHPGHGLLS